MCASCISLLLILLVSCSMRMATEGLPLSRQERGVHHDIIAGADFLSVLMDSPAARQAYKEMSTTMEPSNSLSQYPKEIRRTRSTTSILNEDPPTFTTVKVTSPAQTSSDRTTIKVLANKIKPSENIKSNGSLIISVQVSSSEGDSHINKIPHDIKTSTLSGNVETTSENDQTVISSEEHPSIVAEANKSEFSVDEGEPITRNSGSSVDDFTHEYPANVQPLPSPTKDNLEPYKHHSVIFHDNPKETAARGRSVSYSTVIQSLPKQSETWEETREPEHKERQERHYELRDGANDFAKLEEKRTSSTSTSIKTLVDIPSSSVAESNDYFVTRKYETSSDYHDDSTSERKESSWEKPEQAYVSSESSLRKTHREPTEKNWEVPEKTHGQQEKPLAVTQKNQQTPIVYGKPEQNYEVDEAVSVMSNGRVHGVQSLNKSQFSTPLIETSQKANDNQKVGYVVEGRNYRKYRVEERTSDGFIVGEYGVVSHDDGSLRGVRYTADGTINPRLIYDALMKFLSL